MCGFSTSRTITLKVQFAELLLTSLAVQITKFVPFRNIVPEGGVQLMFTLEQLSVACGTNDTMASQRPVAVFMTKSAGHCREGDSMSGTVTVNSQLPMFKLPSTAEQVTVVTPIWKKEPLGGKQDADALPQLSVAETLKVTGASQRPSAAGATMFVGQWTVGA